MAKDKLLINTNKLPKVLLIGNGLLLLNNGMGWPDLIKALAPDPTSIPDVRGIPYAMQPEAVCGTDVENVQRLIAEKITSKEPHEILSQLVFMDFDAILTTNYTYEIEEALTGGSWNENKRIKSHTTLYPGLKNMALGKFKSANGKMVVGFPFDNIDYSVCFL